MIPPVSGSHQFRGFSGLVLEFKVDVDLKPVQEEFINVFLLPRGSNRLPGRRT
jgi:hypothetical protein